MPTIKTALLLILTLVLQLPTTAQVIKDWSEYEHLKSEDAPTAAALAKKLTTGLKTDEQKAAALYYWTAQNITYDVDLYEKISQGRMKRRAYTPEEILKVWDDRIQQTLRQRKGVCDNYARLYQRMAETVGLNCAYVTGHVRSNAIEAGSMGYTHAWNAVEIDGEWKIVDATWGAGAMRGDKFNKQFREAYFFPEPASLQYSHFPTDAKWQLTDELLDRETFVNLPGIGAKFIAYGIGDLTYDSYAISAPRNEEFIYEFSSVGPIENLVCANMTTAQQISCTAERTEDGYRLTVPAKEVRNMVLSIYSGRDDMLISHRLRVR
ncbi:transglutaminase domain-containing protein [Neolewinella antarctica]|uniref:Transglutaminase/protease-like cytokinesis protein 3 n=1 Tax=Neolewinella antarctica TaxID=442734 RepID=A0ABX0XGH6_9BACT|nr:transglutaminase domain-containing protein [Neolewinella antarctica]NJC28306.1 transglutaminase/protease-like cytokinesis protein 3 [Neolewinella antarctica]